MPRANRYFLPGHVWHITHRCHKKEFLLKFSRDRDRWKYWLFQARKRYGLCVLNYTITSNHIHLLVKDTGDGAVPKSMQLIAGRTAQEYNLRKQRKGAYWEDRYHATAIETDDHLVRCLSYIDLNMVRAGVVKHPVEWAHNGYHEIQVPPQRYAIVDLAELVRLCGFNELATFQAEHRKWVTDELSNASVRREASWTESVAVGSQQYVEGIKEELGIRGKGRQCMAEGDHYQLREPAASYNVEIGMEMEAVSDKTADF